MDRAYWDRIAPRYASCVLDSLREDRTGVITDVIDELAGRRGRRRRTAADLGCGTGHYLPTLAARFRRVLGVDHSPALLEQAAARCAAIPNVELQQVDLSRRSVAGCADVVLSMNVWIGPDRTTRRRLIDRTVASVAQRRRLLLLVPSLESALHANRVLVEWHERDGASHAAAQREGLKPDRRLLDGLVPLDGAATKHYLRVEVEQLLGERGLSIERVERVEYGWRTEFDRPPRWMRDPYPWDWLFVARR